MSSKIINFNPPEQFPILNLKAILAQTDAVSKSVTDSTLQSGRTLNNPEKVLGLEILIRRLELLQHFYLSYKLSPMDESNLCDTLKTKAWMDIITPLEDLIDEMPSSSRK